MVAPGTATRRCSSLRIVTGCERPNYVRRVGIRFTWGGNTRFSMLRFSADKFGTSVNFKKL